MPKIVYVAKNFSTQTLAIIDHANAIIEEYEAQGFILTLRQLFYQFVARVLLPNTDQSYSRIGSIVSDARRAGLIDWNAIEDRTRFLRRNSHWDSPQSLIESAIDGFALDMWEDQQCRPEVWIEKDALVGVIEDVCIGLDIPYFSCRGYVSDSEMWRAALRILRNSRNGQETVILHLGDHDPSGLQMTEDIENRLGLFTGYQGFTVKRIALNYDQVEQYNPPPNPTKLTDSRASAYMVEHGDYSWELDALEPSVMVQLIRDEYDSHCEMDKWAEQAEQQDTYRTQLQTIIDDWDTIFEDKT